MKNKFFFIFVLIYICSSSPSVLCQEWKKNIAPGIEYDHFKISSEAGPIHVHMLKIDLKNPDINVRPELAGGTIGSLESTSDIAIRNNAIAAINGSFFEARKKLHLPVGFMIIDGQVVNKSILERTTMGITKDKELVFGIPKLNGYAVNLENRKSVKIWGVNRPRKNDEVIVYTNEYGKRTRTNKFGKELIVNGDGYVTSIVPGDAAIPDDGYVVSLHGWSRDFIKKTKVGDRVGLDYNLTDKWKDVMQAITGGPLLVRSGEAVHGESIMSENFKSDMLPANARTAIGITADNKLIMIVADKRYKLSKGLTYDELADIMKESGAVDAMGLDGGHASAMYLNGKLVNYPKQGYDAPVSNALIVTYNGWKVAVAPKRKWVAVVVYVPPSDALVKALIESAQLSPTAYIARPEDFGMWGLYDLYNRVIKPTVPDPIIRQLFAGS